MDNSQREMTLTEWCARLPEFHLVNRQLAALEKRVAEQKEITMQAVRDRNEALNELLINRVNMAVLSNRADRAEETARVLGAELEERCFED